MKNLLTATEIDSWSRMNPRRAQEVLPELIVNLGRPLSIKLHCSLASMSLGLKKCWKHVKNYLKIKN